jgi:hypothetical protein
MESYIFNNPKKTVEINFKHDYYRSIKSSFSGFYVGNRKPSSELANYYTLIVFWVSKIVWINIPKSLILNVKGLCETNKFLKINHIGNRITPVSEACKAL